MVSLICSGFDRQRFGQSKDSFALLKKTSTVQYGYREQGTHVRVFFETLEHGNSKNEIG